MRGLEKGRRFSCRYSRACWKTLGRLLGESVALAGRTGGERGGYKNLREGKWRCEGETGAVWALKRATDERWRNEWKDSLLSSSWMSSKGEERGFDR